MIRANAYKLGVACKYEGFISWNTMMQNPGISRFHNARRYSERSQFIVFIVILGCVEELTTSRWVIRVLEI